MTAQEEVLQTVRHIQSVSQQYLAGDPAPFQACWSHGEDVTLCGGWGAYERGWAHVEPRLAWGATRYRGGHMDFELVSLMVHGDLAYTVWIERGEVRVSEQDELHPSALRVTQIYRREAANWKIIHRHAMRPGERRRCSSGITRPQHPRVAAAACGSLRCLR